MLTAPPARTPVLAFGAAIALAFLAPCALGETTTDADVDFTETSTGGHLIIVPRAVLPAAGFVAVHDSTLLTYEDPFHSVIGITKAMPAGTYLNVSVELGSVNGNNKAFTMNATDTIIAMPHKDSNNNGVYDFITSNGADDGPFVGGAHATQTFAGNIVLASAAVTRGSLTVAANQLTDGATFKVAWVDLSSPGFVAIHDTTLVTAQDLFGSVIAVGTKLEAGLHPDVSVPFGKNGATQTGKLSQSQMVIVMPHKDTNHNSVYDFTTSQGAEDGPYPGVAQTFAGKIDLVQAMATLSEPSSNSPSPYNSNDDQGTPGLSLMGLLVGVAAATMISARRRR